MKANKIIETLKNYEAGKPIELVVREFGIAPEDVVKLASNENPKGTNPAVLKAIIDSAHKAHLYPDDSMYALKEALAKRYAVEPNEIIIGAGSDQVLDFIARAFLNEQSSVLMSQVTFAMYEIYAKQLGAKIIRTPSYQHRVDEFIEAYQLHHPKIVYICTPNNPTGDAISKADVLKIIEAVDEETLVVVDGAYMEYASAKDDRFSIAPKDLMIYPNVIYLGTFSKAYALGGMRIGYGIAPHALIQTLSKVRPPFNITTLSMVAAVEALKDQDFVHDSIALHSQEIERYEAFARDHGINYIDSYTNFITYILRDGQSSTQIANRLLEKGVIIRDLASYGMNALRITVGTPIQNDIFFRKYLEVAH